MKTTILILNILGVLCSLGWAGYIFVASFGQSMWSLSGKPTFFDTISSYVPLSVLAVSVLTIVLSRTYPRQALIWSLCPFLYLGLMHLYLEGMRTKYRAQRQAEDKVQRETVTESIAGFSRDFIQKNVRPYSGIKEEFISVDREQKYVLLVQNKYLSFDIYIKGSVNGDIMTVFDRLWFGEFLRNDYSNAEGKSISAEYKLIYKPAQFSADYNLQTRKVEIKKKRFEVTLSCSANSDCQYFGKDLPIEITVTNRGNDAVNFPTKFLQKSGPSIVLSDPRNERSRTELPSSENLVPAELKNDLQTLAPGDAIKISSVIHSSDIEKTSLAPVDVLAEIEIWADIEIGGKKDFFVGVDGVRIGPPQKSPQ